MTKNIGLSGEGTLFCHGSRVKKLKRSRSNLYLQLQTCTLLYVFLPTSDGPSFVPLAAAPEAVQPPLFSKFDRSKSKPAVLVLPEPETRTCEHQHRRRIQTRLKTNIKQKQTNNIMLTTIYFCFILCCKSRYLQNR